MVHLPWRLVLFHFACRSASVDNLSRATTLPDLTEPEFQFRLHASGLSDDAVDGDGLFPELPDVVVRLRHAPMMI